MRQRARIAFGLSVATICAAIVLAAHRFPGGFDWVYTVMSSLASRKANPSGGLFFALGLALSLGFLWPAVSWIKRCEPDGLRLGRIGANTLRVGIFFGILVGLERLVFFHISQVIRKGHEALALLCFLNLYAGVLMLYLARIRRRAAGKGAMLFVLAPLLAIGINQIAIYLDQRDLGWVGVRWREMGIPFWLSFAFWQWLAAAVLWTAIGHLTWLAAPPSARDGSPQIKQFTKGQKSNKGR